MLTISVVLSTVHEVGREQGVLTTSVIFSTVHEVGREQGVLTISVVFSTVLQWMCPSLCAAGIGHHLQNSTHSPYFSSSQMEFR